MYSTLQLERPNEPHIQSTPIQSAPKPMCHFNFDILLFYCNILHGFSLLGLSQIFLSLVVLLSLPLPNSSFVLPISERDTFNAYSVIIISYNSGTVDLDLYDDRCYYLYVTLKKNASFLAVCPNDRRESCLNSHKMVTSLALFIINTRL